MAAMVLPRLTLSFLFWQSFSDFTLQNTAMRLSAAQKGFPDLGYAILGYDSLKGFPLSVGHDPGFTLPIFAADYSQKLKTADGRYDVPSGLMVIPDVSCVTSFSSRLIDSMSSLESSLSVSANVKGGGWGISFSASVGFKQAMSEVSTNKYKLIVSTASCDYYYVRLLERGPPPFDPLFVEWVKELNKTDGELTYLNFIETYGTHYLTAATFGASFHYEYRMSTEAYERQQEVALSAAASFSASFMGFSGGGGVEMSAEMKSAVSAFQASVETKTITVGSPPPANGDAMTWASTVQDNPVPVKYTLNSIENLFTGNFMGDGIDDQGTAVDYQRIRSRIIAMKAKYCELLNVRGLVDDCSSTQGVLVLDFVQFDGHPYVETASSFSKCNDLCAKRTSCVAADFCVKCTSEDVMYQKCRMYAADGVRSGMNANAWRSVVRLDKLQHLLVVQNTAITGIERAHSDVGSASTSQECLELCLGDEYCVAFTFCPCPDSQKCTLYSEKYMVLTSKPATAAFFLSPAARDVYRSGAKPPLYMEGAWWRGPACKSGADCEELLAACPADGFCRCSLARGVQSDFKRCSPTAYSCLDRLDMGQTESGLATIEVNGRNVSVYCDQKTDGGGWTVIQRRQDGSVNFYQNWDNYRKGFGNKNGEFWLGLDLIHEMTTSANYSLRVDLEGFDGTKKYEEYATFYLGGPEENFKLHIGEFTGTAGDGLYDGVPFSTYDRDNDAMGDFNCAENKQGAWWFASCSHSSLNGKYTPGGRGQNTVWWWRFQGNDVSLKRTEMKIRPISI